MSAILTPSSGGGPLVTDTQGQPVEAAEKKINVANPEAAGMDPGTEAGPTQTDGAGHGEDPGGESPGGNNNLVAIALAGLIGFWLWKKYK